MVGLALERKIGSQPTLKKKYYLFFPQPTKIVFKYEHVFDKFRPTLAKSCMIFNLTFIKVDITQYKIYVYTFRLPINNLKVMNSHRVFVSFHKFSVRLLQV